MVDGRWKPVIFLSSISLAESVNSGTCLNKQVLIGFDQGFGVPLISVPLRTTRWRSSFEDGDEALLRHEVGYQSDMPVRRCEAAVKLRGARISARNVV